MKCATLPYTFVTSFLCLKHLLQSGYFSDVYPLILGDILRKKKHLKALFHIVGMLNTDLLHICYIKKDHPSVVQKEYDGVKNRFFWSDFFLDHFIYVLNDG